MTRDETLDAVRDFWSGHPCDSDRSVAGDRRQYYEEIERWRYANHPSIIEAARFSEFRALDVLRMAVVWVRMDASSCALGRATLA